VKEQFESLLGGYRALDLTDEKGYFCGRILGDLGADVIKIEKPGGDPGRNLGPFYNDIPDPQKSLNWFAYNSNKRGITLDIETVEGRELFLKLVKTADWVIESFTPGYMDSLGLSYEKLSQINPGIIFTSISSFGQDGPYENYKGSDLVCTALGGFLYLTGDRDRAPVRIGFPQSYLHASSVAADGSLTALYYREITGEGQHVDIAAQSIEVHLMVYAAPGWDYLRKNEERQGSRWTRPGARWLIPAHYQCKDGYVYWYLMGGLIGARGNEALVKWMDREGLATNFLRDMDWYKFNLYDPEVDQAYVDRITSSVTEFFKLHTKKELLEIGVKEHMFVFPCGSAKDALENSQLAARDYWVQVEHPELNDTITYPGPFIKLSEHPISLRRRAPLLGEHNEDIFINELNISREALLTLKQAGVI
jgi:crotonobetainyl-CoA:carnitine CoA-transferase CaiB-like acyl-CoA transferase